MLLWGAVCIHTSRCRATAWLSQLVPSLLLVLALGTGQWGPGQLRRLPGSRGLWFHVVQDQAGLWPPELVEGGLRPGVVGWGGAGDGMGPLP